MKKHFYFILTLLMCLPVMLHAQENARYLVGAVPEEDGKIVFRKEFLIPNTSQQAIYDCVHKWMGERLAKNKNNSRVVYTDAKSGIISGAVEEYLVFKSNSLSLDRAFMSYQINAMCSEGKCDFEIERIRYTYDDEKITAEDYISDENALNKSKTKLVRGLSKFRIKTVDYVDDTFKDVQNYLAVNISGIGAKQPAAAAQPVINNEPVVIQTEPTTPLVTVAPVIERPIVQQPEIKAEITAVPSSGPSSLSGYRQIAPDKLPGNIIKMLNDDWMLITAGNQQQFNMMTASWGSLGVLYGKPVAMCFINPTRYTYQLMEKNDTYTLTFYTEAYRDALKYCGSNSGKNTDKVKGSGLTPVTTPEGSQAFSEAWLIIECRKMVSQSLTPEAISNEKVKEEWAGKQLHKMYIGEIINVWVK